MVTDWTRLELTDWNNYVWMSEDTPGVVAGSYNQHYEE
jgi:hypothetical protein